MLRYLCLIMTFSFFSFASIPLPTHLNIEASKLNLVDLKAKDSYSLHSDDSGVLLRTIHDEGYVRREERERGRVRERSRLIMITFLLKSKTTHKTHSNLPSNSLQYTVPFFGNRVVFFFSLSGWA